METFREYSALVAAILSGLLLVFMVIRSPRNVFTFLLAGVVACIFEWNLTEWLRKTMEGTGPERIFHSLQGIGQTVLAPLFFHFSLQLCARIRAPTRWLVLAYGAMSALLYPVVGSLFSDQLYEIYYRDAWNYLFVAFNVPPLVAAVTLLVRRWRRAPRESRSIFSFPLLAALVLGPFGIAEMVLDTNMVEKVAPLANFAGALASAVLVAGVFRNREIFDAIVRLRESTAHLLEVMKRGLVTFDYQGATILCNDPAITLLGKRPSKMDDLDSEIRELFPAGGQCYFKRDARILKATAVRVEAPIEEASYSHLLIEDSTEEYRMLHEFSQRESLASLGEAATTLAHEIRNPLAAISITVDAMEKSKQVERIRGQIQRLNAFIQDRLDFARPVVPKLQTCDLNRLLRKIGELSPLPAHLELSDGLPPVHADPDLLGQVFANLIRNAVEADAKSVEIATAQDGKQVSVRVFNEGSPIPPDVLGRLFEPFFTTKDTGSGIGLALSKKILTAHGGDIAARNVEHGVEFEVRLPWTS